MTEMLERVAKALAGWELGLTGNLSRDQERYAGQLDERLAAHAATWPERVDQARMVVEAMREPTDRMAQIGGEYFEEGAPGENKLAATIVYQAMIDAALARHEA